MENIIGMMEKFLEKYKTKKGIWEDGKRIN
jgi:hypothetical protein